MEALAAGLTDVGVRHPHPLMFGGVEQHLLDLFAIALLHEGPLGEGAAGFVQALREIVPQGLELAEAE